jgi:mono/diheme cytochrome c family protein
MRTRLFILLPLGLAIAGCSQNSSTPAGPTPNPNATFSSIQRDIFETTDASGRAACSKCHTSTGRSPAGGLDLNHDTAYDQLVNMPTRAMPGAMRVIPGDPDHSYLVGKIEGASGIAGQRMPSNGPYLTEAQIANIKQWIALGAPRN